MHQFKAVRSGKLLKRASQVAYLFAHPIDHLRSASAIGKSGLAPESLNLLKYLGDYLSRALVPNERREALSSHYECMPGLISSLTRSDLQHGVLIWKKDVGAGLPPLKLVLEASRYAPMEGELQLRFAFKSDLYVLTFLFSCGHVFGRQSKTLIFVGGIQGVIGVRAEIREAAKLNGEIDPATMLIIALQSLASATGVSDILAVGEEDQVSMGYAREKIKLDYKQFWRELGAVQCGTYYRLPLHFSHKPLSEISRSHRRRTKFKREEKQRVREAIDGRILELCRAPDAHR